MKLTETQLKRIIKETVCKVINENRWTDGSSELYAIDKEDDELMDSESDENNWRKFSWHVLNLATDNGIPEDVMVEGELYDPPHTPYARYQRKNGLGLEAPNYPDSPVSSPVQTARNVTIKRSGPNASDRKPRSYNLSIAKIQGGTMLRMVGKLADTGEVRHFRFTFDE